MFNGEYVSLNEILKTNTLKVPKPLKVCLSTPRQQDLNFYIEGMSTFGRM